MANGMGEKRVWGIHSQDDVLFLKGNVIAIGWKDMGDLSAIGTSREEFVKKYESAYPSQKKRATVLSAGMLYRFYNEMQIGDYG